MKRWLWGVATALVVGFAGLNGLAYNHARAMMRFTSAGSRTAKPERLPFWSKAKVLLLGVNVPRPTDGRLPSDLAADCRVLSIPGQDGITLAAWYADRGQETPLVILFHGYGTGKTSLLREAKALLDGGLSVLLVDFRGSGGSSETYTTLGVDEADDVVAATRYAQTRLNHRRIMLFGQSMGAVAILKAVHDGGIMPDGVILEAVFDTMLNTVRNRFHAMRVPAFPSAELLVFWGGRQCGFNGFQHNPVEYAASLRCPSLCMHGRDDPRAALTEGRRVYDRIPGPKAFKVFDRTGHESYVSLHEREWRFAVEAFMRRVGDARTDWADARGP